MGRRTPLTPEQLERRRKINRDYMARQRGSGTKGIMRQGSHGPVPRPETILERDRRLGFVQTLGQRYLGDPMPGRSALDQMRDKV